MNDARTILSVRNLCTVFGTARGEVTAVDDVSFDVREGEVVGIVGESGSGKSVTALSIMGLLPQPPGRVAGGSIEFDGRDLLTLTSREMRQIRGGAIGMIFQEPMTSLNPVFPIGDQIIETVRVHERVGAREARERAIDMLKKVGIPSPERRVDDYPHQLSGGMRQRVMIAMALSCKPKLLIADEPTTALDVTIQAQILDLLRELQSEFRMAIMIITHNMGVIAEFADRVVVMYAGRIAEEGPVGAIFDDPRHPYTIGLLASTPDMATEVPRLRTIAGALPSLHAMPEGCRFAPRCDRRIGACEAARPELQSLGAQRLAACIRLGAPVS